MSTSDTDIETGATTSEAHSPSSHSKEHHQHHKHHRHRRRKKWPSSKTELRKAIKKHKKLLTNLFLILVVVIILISFICLIDWYSKKDAGLEEQAPATETSIASNDSSVLISVPFFENEVYLIGDAALACAKADAQVPVDEILERYKEDHRRLAVGLPVDLSFEITGLPATCSVSRIAVEVSENSSFQAPRVFSLARDERNVSISHLKTGTRYYYRINIELSNQTVTSVSGSFKTADTPRIMSVDGIINVRDIGGWKTTDGKTIRQGMLYRGSEMDGAVESSYLITPEGVSTMLSVLGVRTDMDLRSPTDNPYDTDALGANVEHIYYDMLAYSDVLTAAGMEKIRTVFSDLADEQKYPVYLHCTYGMDRTGTVCYLLEALLGVPEDDLLREYRLSGLCHFSLSCSPIKTLAENLQTYPGNTMQEKVENFLLSAGVTEKEIRTIKQLMLQ